MAIFKSAILSIFEVQFKNFNFAIITKRSILDVAAVLDPPLEGFTNTKLVQILYFWSIPKCGNKIQNFVGGNNQFKKCFRQKLEKCFIDIKILPRFTKPRVVMTLYKKSAKLYLTLVHFIFLNVHIGGSNKYGWILTSLRFSRDVFCIRFLYKIWFCK